jgi:hypothetical protein
VLGEAAFHEQVKRLIQGKRPRADALVLHLHMQACHCICACGACAADHNFAEATRQLAKYLCAQLGQAADPAGCIEVQSGSSLLTCVIANVKMRE